MGKFILIRAGDEIGSTQKGNNNAYCQDNEISWVDWNLTESKKQLLQFTQKLMRLRREQPVFRRRNFFQGRLIRGSGVKDITWLDVNGQEMTDEAWNASSARSLGVLLSGDAIQEVDERGERIVGDTLLLLMNASGEDAQFILPACRNGFKWEFVLDTFDLNLKDVILIEDQKYKLESRSLAVFILIERPVKNGVK